MTVVFRTRSSSCITSDFSSLKPCDLSEEFFYFQLFYNPYVMSLLSPFPYDLVIMLSCTWVYGLFHLLYTSLL